MIVLAGIPSEPPLRLAIEAAEAQDIEHVVLNQRHAEQIDIELEACTAGITGNLWIAGARYPFSEISGLYARTVETGTLPEFAGEHRSTFDPLASARARATLALLNELLDVAPFPVVNRPMAMTSNMSKPYQAQIIRRAGLDVPETLVTNDPDELLAFHRRHGRIIYKSTSGLRSIVREWLPATGPTPGAVRALPTQFQARVPGTDVRVHVVGNRCFATQIHSEAIDYRYSERDGLELDMVPFELPGEIARICVDLSRRLGLLLSGIDLKRTPEGQWFCFEVNPSPAYSFFEEMAGQPIARAIVELLDRGAQDGCPDGADCREPRRDQLPAAAPRS